MTEQKATSNGIGVPVHGLEHASVVKFTGDRVAGYAESVRHTMQSAADEVGSTVETHLSGKPPQGESDSLMAATILIGVLNSRGASWGVVTTAEDPADCETTNESGLKLRVQVIRASGKSDIWYQLGVAGVVDESSGIAGLVNELEAAIQRKAQRYPPAVQSGLVLALDANRLPAFVLSSVRDAAIDRLRSLCKNTNFSSVWVVGPTAELTYALFEKA